ncbi:hypothetical protein [Edaphovirga cremea]|uniref:hypothetical protein n=1 Tax=Edaphovirga cremea TaxID=2267246 RepID=UPI0039896A23
MRITAETDKSLVHYRMLAFVANAVAYLQQNYRDVISARDIPDESLELGIRQSYHWTTLQQRPSQLLALRVASARLCFGSFFMEDPRYSALQRIITEQVATIRLTDDDPVFEYIAQHQPDWEQDWFRKDFNTIVKLITSRRMTPRESPEWLSGENILHHLLLRETRTACHITAAAHPEFIRLIKAIVAKKLPVTVNGHESVLLAIGQYYDGLYCFDDPFRPRWFNALAGNLEESKRYRIQRVFELDI